MEKNTPIETSQFLYRGLKGRPMDIKPKSLTQEITSLQIRCEQFKQQLERVQRICLAELSSIRVQLAGFGDVEKEVAKWQHELQHEANQLRSQGSNLKT